MKFLQRHEAGSSHLSATLLWTTNREAVQILSFGPRNFLSLSLITAEEGGLRTHYSVPLCVRVFSS